MANNNVPIPSTLGRLRPYIAVYSAPWDGSLDTLPTRPSKELGTITEFDLKVKRETSTWREFSSVRPGLATETVPGLPNYEVAISKIMLNKDLQNGTADSDSLMTLFGFNAGYNGGWDIISQDKPLVIWLQLLSPRDSNGATIAGYPEPKTLMFVSCWFDGFPMKFSVDDSGEMTTRQESSFKAAYMIAS